MKSRAALCAVVCVGFSAMIMVKPVRAQTFCATNQDTAVECFVGDAVTTRLFTPHFGMTAAEFETYGVAVSHILQDTKAYVVVLGMASAVADAMPPTDANGTANGSPQQNAMNLIVRAAVADGIVTPAEETNEQDLEWFALDLVTAMNENTGILLSPGALLRAVDSYVITATVNGVVNWTLLNNNLGTMLGTLVNSKLLKLPQGVSLTQAQEFALSIARVVIYYKQATGRTTL
jgi:hypothetical protein